MHKNVLNLEQSLTNAISSVFERNFPQERQSQLELLSSQKLISIPFWMGHKSITGSPQALELTASILKLTKPN